MIARVVCAVAAAALGLVSTTHGFSWAPLPITPWSRTRSTIVSRRPVLLVTGSSLFDSSSKLDDDDATAGQSAPPKPEPNAKPKPDVVKCPNCDLCDGSGRIPGGIGAVLPWIPIKAYRPCPNFIANGGFYERSGQGLDEIAFGRDSTFEK